MKISLNWLKEYIDIPKDITPEKLGELLTLHSFEVEGVESQGEFLDGVLVGEMLEIKKHPNADKLSVAKVDVGEGKPRQIVFGQMVKMEIGFKVPVALAPTVLPGGNKIQKAKLRGELSEGMLCLDQELGLKKDGVDIHFFDKDVKNGTLIIEVLNLDDFILEVDNKTITHRPDLWGHCGIAREVGAILKAPLTRGVGGFAGLKENIEIKKTQKHENTKTRKHENTETQKHKKRLQVEVKNYELCRRYMGVVIDNITIAPSPSWLQNRLNSVGVRSINNIVDITNYVMLDTGQPLHAFDYNKLFGGENSAKIIVRKAKAGERIITLDGVERKLNKEMLVIADEKDPVALAGVMGGANSDVGDGTKRIVLEIANFEPINIRQTSAKVGLRTESVMRFEKSLDPNLPEVALKRVLGLISEIIPEANVCSEIVDKKRFKLNQGPIVLSKNYVNKRIGVEISSKDISDILERLGFEVEINPPNPPLRKGGIKNPQPRAVGIAFGDARPTPAPSAEPLAAHGLVRGEQSLDDVIFEVKVPSWRATKDVSIADDLVEEVARIYGFNKIQAKAPLVNMEAPEVNRKRKFERGVKNILNSLGFDEVYNYGLVGKEQVEKMGYDPDDNIKLINSLSVDFALLRKNLCGNLIVNIKDNLRYFDKFKIFEIGSVFNKGVGNYSAGPTKRRAGVLCGETPAGQNIGSVFNKGNGEYLAFPDKKAMLPDEKKMLVGVVVDVEKKAEDIFSETKEAVENLFAKFRVGDYRILPAKNGKGVRAEIFVKNKKIGKIILLDKKVQDNFDINSKLDCGFFEIDLFELFNFLRFDFQYKSLAKFPETKIDLAVIASEEILWHNIEEEIKKAAGLQLKKIELFDVYVGKNIGEGKKSFAMHLNFGEDERTMEMGEVEKLRDKIVGRLKVRLGVEIRG